MRYRVTLSNPLLGSSILEKEPKGLNDIAPTIKRGPNHGLTEEIDVKLEFYCGAGKEYIDQVIDDQGPGAEIKIYIDYACGCEPGSSAPDYSIDYSDDYGSQTSGDCDFQEFYTGRLDLKTWESDKEFTKVNIDPDGILQTVKNRLNTKVDLFALETMNGTPLDPFTFGPYDLTLHGRKILIKSQFKLTEPGQTSGLFANGSNVNIHLPFYPEIGEIISSETVITDFQIGGDIPYVIQVNQNLESLKLTYRLKGTVTLEHALTPGAKYAVGNFLVRAVHNNSGIELFTSNSGGQFTGDYTFNFDVSGAITYSNVLDGDTIKLYIFIATDSPDSPDIDPNDNFPFRLVLDMDVDNSFANFEGESLEADTTAKAFAAFETGAQIARVISDQPDVFRSEYFGRKNSEPFAYDNNGCGSFRSFLNGFLIRGFPTTGDQARTIRMSMNDYFNGLNPIDNLGLGIEKTGDNYHVVIDRKEYFYDSSTVLLTLNHVPDLKRSIVPEYIHSLINVGFEKWETEFINGLDEFNSKRQFDTLNNFVNNELNLLSGLVASGNRLELTRRKQFSESFTEDSEYDEDNFIVCLSKSVDGLGVPDELDITEKDENFDSVENIYSPETAYNLDISPERNLLRWGNVINAGLTKYPGRQIKFTSGEGNYKIETDYINSACPGRWNNEPFAGGQDFAWDDANNSDKDPIWLPIVFEFEFPLTRAQYEIIRAYPKGVIEISSTDTGHEKAFILDLKYKEGQKSAFKLLKSYQQ